MADSKKRLEEINKLLKDSKTTAEEKAKLTKEENTILKEQIKLQSESLDLSSAMVDSIKEALNINTRRSTADANLLKVNKQINSTILNQVVGATSLADVNKQIAKNQKSINKTKALEASLENEILTSGRRNQKQRLGIVKSASNLSMKLDQEIKKREELLEAASRGEKIDKDALANSNKMVGDLGAQLDRQMRFLSAEEKKLLFTKNNIKLLEAQNSEREKEKEKIENINKKLGVGGGILEGLSKIPLISNVVDLPKIMDKSRKATEKTGSGIKGLGAGFKEMKKQAISGLLNPANLALGAITGAITMLTAALKGADKEAGEFSKEMGISYQEALKLSGEMNAVASASGDIAVTQQGLMKAQKSLNEYFGVGAKFSGEIAEEFASIQKRTGLSDKAMGFFTKTAMKSGKDTKDILLNVNKTTLELNKQNKMSLSNKQVQEGIAKLSNSIKLSAEGNVEELTKAVFASKKLGASMAQIEGIASGLLDFESSIQNELEAELLLGQDINLEKARQFALEGNMVRVSEEVLKNKAIMNAFETKNVIAQEAAAKALNMSRDDLANMVTEQQNLATLQKAYGDDVTSMSDAQKKYNELRASGVSAEEAGKELGDESLANQLETISAAEKMENIMTRIQQLFMSLAEPIMAVITPIIDLLIPALQVVSFLFQGIGDLLGWLLTPVGWIVDGFKYLGDLATMFGEKITELTSGMGLLGTIFRGLAYIVVLMAGYLAYASLAWIPVVGSILGAVAAATVIAKGFAAINSSPKKAGDMMSEADGKTQVSTKEGGLFELSPNDDLVAAPGAVDQMNRKGEGGKFEGGGGKPERGGGARRDAALIAKVEQLIATTQQVVNINQQILAKSPVIEMGGNEVGQGINKAEREIQ